MTQATFINFGGNPTNFSNIPESHPAVVDIDDRDGEFLTRLETLKSQNCFDYLQGIYLEASA